MYLSVVYTFLLLDHKIYLFTKLCTEMLRKDKYYPRASD